jgi:hypothetical protein
MINLAVSQTNPPESGGSGAKPGEGTAQETPELDAPPIPQLPSPAATASDPPESGG